MKLVLPEAEYEHEIRHSALLDATLCTADACHKHHTACLIPPLRQHSSIKAQTETYSSVGYIVFSTLKFQKFAHMDILRSNARKQNTLDQINNSDS